jgi:hypothetical protein
VPAPNRRNHGSQGLADKIVEHSAPRSIDDRRDRLKAQRVRDAQQWEDNAAALESRLSGADLVAAGQAIRAQADRAYHLARYSADVKAGNALPPSIPQVALRWLGVCWDCERELWVASARPRVPLCNPCKVRRVAAEQRRRKPREAKAA